MSSSSFSWLPSISPTEVVGNNRSGGRTTAEDEQERMHRKRIADQARRVAAVASRTSGSGSGTSGSSKRRGGQQGSGKHANTVPNKKGDKSGGSKQTVRRSSAPVGQASAKVSAKGTGGGGAKRPSPKAPARDAGSDRSAGIKQGKCNDNMHKQHVENRHQPQPQPQPQQPPPAPRRSSAPAPKRPSQQQQPSATAGAKRPSPTDASKRPSNPAAAPVQPPRRASSDDVEVGMSGWLDGLGSFMGLRPPTTIDLTLPPPTTRSGAVVANASPSRNGTSDKAAKGTSRTNNNIDRASAPSKPQPPQVPQSAPGRLASNNKSSSGSGGGCSGQTTKSKKSPNALTPPGDQPTKKKEDVEQMQQPRKSSSSAGSNNGKGGGKAGQQVSTKKEAKGQKPPSKKSPSKNPSSKKPSSNGNSSGSKPKAAATPSTRATLSPRSKSVKKSSSEAAGSGGGGNMSSGTKKKAGPIKLISSSQRPTIATLPPKKVVSKPHPIATATATANNRRKKRHRRQISGEIIALLEQDSYGSDEDDVISVKETFVEGVKSWKPTFFSRLNGGTDEQQQQKEQRHRHRREQHRDASRTRHADRSSSRRRTSPTTSNDRKQHRSSSARRKRGSSISRRSDPSQRTSSMASSDTGSSRSGSSKREELERTMNVPPRQSRGLSKQNKRDSKGISGNKDKSDKTSSQPSSTVATTAGTQNTSKSRKASSSTSPRNSDVANKRSSSKSKGNSTRTSLPGKRSRAAATSSSNGAGIDLEAGLGKPPRTPSPSKHRIKGETSNIERGKKPPSPAPKKQPKKASPARSTESSRTALTERTSGSYDDSPKSSPRQSLTTLTESASDLESGRLGRSALRSQPSRSASKRKQKGKILEEHDAIVAVRSSEGRLESSPSSFIVDRTPPPRPPTKEEIQKQKAEARQVFYANNFALFAHGRITTVIPVFCAGLALILSVIAKRSTNFVTLNEPMFVSPTFEKVDKVGLVYLDLCLADEITTVAAGSGIKTVVGRDYRGVAGRSSPAAGDEGFVGKLLTWVNPPSIEAYDEVIEDYDHDDYVFVGPTDDEFETDLAGWDENINAADARKPKICRSIKITSTTLNDSLWNVSRTFLSLAIGFGFFLAFMLSSAAYWSTINLKPVAVGLLMTYFFQSMSFFFFDSEICRKHNCTMSSGAASDVAASIFWFASAIGTIWMDFVLKAKIRRKERRERRRRRRERRARRARRMKEAIAAFEAKKKAEKINSSWDSGTILSAEVELIDDTYHSYDFESDTSESPAIYLSDSDEDGWIENGIVYDDYVWEDESESLC